MPEPEKTETIPSKPAVSPAPAALPASRKKGGPGCACLGCLLAPILLVIGVFCVGAWFVAAAGFRDIPVFTALAYQRPTPIHVVTVLPDQSQPLFPPETLKALSDTQNAADPQQAFDNAFNGPAMQQLFSQLSRFGSPSANGSFTISIPESTLTATLRQTQPSSQDASGQAVSSPFDFSTAQIAVSKLDGVEVFLPLMNNPVGSAFVLRFRPAVEGGSLTADITLAQFGNLRVPDAWLSQIDDKTLHPALQSAAPSLKKLATFTRAEAEDGSLRLEGTFVAPSAP